MIYKIPLENFWIQYVLYPMEIGSTRYDLIDFNFKKINYLKVELQIKEKRKFLERIIKTYENN